MTEHVTPEAESPPTPAPLEYRKFKELPWNKHKLARLFAEGWTVASYSSWNNRYLLQRPKRPKRL